MYALFLRPDADFADLARLLKRVNFAFLSVSQWTDTVACLVAKPSALHARANVIACERINAGVHACDVLTFLAYVRALAELGAPAVLLCKAYSLTAEMHLFDLHALLAPLCTAVPWPVPKELASVYPAKMCSFIVEAGADNYTHGLAWMIAKGARMYVAPSTATTVQAHTAAWDAATAAFVAVMTTPVAPEKKEPVSEKTGKCKNAKATRDAPESPKKKRDVRTFNLSWRGDPFEYDLTAIRADDDKVERKAVTVLGSPLGNRLMEFHHAINQAMFKFTNDQKSLLVWDYAASCLKLREDVEQALANYYDDYEVKEE